MASLNVLYHFLNMLRVCFKCIFACKMKAGGLL